MFTRFAAARRSPFPQLAGALVSLTAHAALLVVALGGDLRLATGDRSPDDPPPDPAARAARGGERLQWVGLAPDAGDGGAARPGGRPPVAYVIPGRGALREGTPGEGELRRRVRRPDAPPAPPIAPRRPAEAPGAGTRELRLPPSVPLEAEATLLVAGVIASAPDLVERPRRVDAFTALPVAELAGTVDLDASETLRPLGRVDVLPIALVSNPRPSYPAALAQLRRGGRVVVEFTIDSAGAVAPGSFRVVESTDARFTQAVHAVVPQLRFVPAQLDRHAVGLTVRQPFVFVLRPGL